MCTRLEFTSQLPLISPTLQHIRRVGDRNSLTPVLINLLLIVLSIAGMSLPLRGEAPAVRVGDILVPPPEDMVELSDYSDAFRTMFKAAPKKTFGLYYLVAEFSDVSTGKLIMASQNAHGILDSVSATEQEAADRHMKMMTGLERDVAAHKTSSEEFQRLIREGTKETEINLPGLKIDIQGVAVLDLDVSKRGKGSFTIVSNTALVEGGKQSEITLVSCNGYLRVKRTIIHLVYNARLKDANTPAKAIEALNAWMTAIEAKNAR